MKLGGARDDISAYRAKRSHRGSYYTNAYKRHTDCEIFIEWSGLRCLCCRGCLRGEKNTRCKGQEKKAQSKVDQRLIGILKRGGKFEILEDNCKGKYIGIIVDASDVIRCVG